MLKQFIPVLLLATLSTVGLYGHFLWKVDSEKPSYLYGTVHSSDRSVRELPPEVIAALGRSDSFHPELELSPENIGGMTAAMFSPQSRDLKEELPGELWERLIKNGRQIGIPTGLLRRIHIGLVPLLFSSPPNSEFNLIVDVQIYEMAKKKGLAIHQLETVQEQISVFKTLDREQAILLLENSLMEFEEGFPSLDKLLGFYSAGDLYNLFEYMEEKMSLLGISGLKESLIERRNQTMVDRLLPYLEKGGAFAAVGIGHMPGEGGIVSLLEKHGYKVRAAALGNGH